VGQGIIPVNPGAAVKELRRVQLAPRGLARSEVRRLLREVELRGDTRASAIFHVLLFTGARVSDAVQLELEDLMLGERSGTVVYRHGKGGKQRSCPLPLNARRAVAAYLETRPSVESQRVFIGERGPLTDKGIRALCEKYSALSGVRLHPHLFRHTFSHQYLADGNNDLVGLSQIYGWESLNTASRYTQRTAAQLSDSVERLTY
jgi:site-specific recombinase XerD